MFTKRIIPCLDVNNGRVVKGINFLDLRDAGDPVEVGAAYGKKVQMSLYFLILQPHQMRGQPRLIWYAVLQKQCLYHLQLVVE